MRRLFLSMLVIAATALVVGPSSSASSRKVWTLQAQNGSGVTGKVVLHGLHGGGTRITVVVEGLEPNTEYVSIYYNNSTCELEPDSAEDTFARYRGNDRGKARIRVNVAEDIDEIGSVSVRLGDGLNLLSCASAP